MCGPLGSSERSSLVTGLGQNYRLQFPVLVSYTPKGCQPPLKQLFLVEVSWGTCHAKCCPHKDEDGPYPGEFVCPAQSCPVCSVQGSRHLSSCRVLSAKVSLQPGTMSGMQHRLNISFAFKGYLLLHFLMQPVLSPCFIAAGCSSRPKSSDFCLVWNALIYREE